MSLQQLVSPHFHLRERKKLLSEIFQRGSDVIDRVIDNHKAVVDVVGLGERDRVVLAVVLLEVQQKGLRYLSRADLCCHFWFPFREHQQHAFVYIVVNQYDPCPGGVYQLCCEHICIEDLSVVEYAFHRRQRGADEEVDFLFVVL